MRLVTWNVNSLRARLPRVLELVAQHAPDVLCLQETKVEPGQFPHDELREAGYEAVDLSGGRWCGVAVAARTGLGLEQAQRGLPGEPDPAEARYVEARVAGVAVASVYVPNGRAVDSVWYEDKLRFLAALASHARSRRPPFVIAGDVNVCPTDLDVYEPSALAGETHVTARERAALAEVVEAGLVDAFRHVHPDVVQYTWWDYRAGNFHKNLGLRIDLALVSPDLATRIVRCGMERDYRKGARPSDHAPLLLDLAG